MPFRRISFARPLPPVLLLASVQRVQPLNPVPFLRFFAASTVSSARRSRACCIPLPALGFVVFQTNHRVLSLTSRHRLDRNRSGGSLPLFPQHGIPLEEPPSKPAVLHHCNLSLRAVFTTSRFCSGLESVPSHFRCRKWRACPSMGFFPFQGLPTWHRSRIWPCLIVLSNDASVSHLNSARMPKTDSPSKMMRKDTTPCKQGTAFW